MAIETGFCAQQRLFGIDTYDHTVFPLVRNVYPFVSELKIERMLQKKFAIITQLSEFAITGNTHVYKTWAFSKVHRKRFVILIVFVISEFAIMMFDCI